MTLLFYTVIRRVFIKTTLAFHHHGREDNTNWFLITSWGLQQAQCSTINTCVYRYF